MFKNLGDMAKLMSEAKKMQEKLAEAQARVAEIEASGEAGAGLVRAVASAQGELRALSIDPSLLTPEDAETVQDLVIAAANAAAAAAREAAQAEMAKLTEGLPLPPGMTSPLG